MEHYICTGSCMGTSEKPSKCTDEKCNKFGQDMESCDCTDGKHHDRQTPKNDAPPISTVL